MKAKILPYILLVGILTSFGISGVSQKGWDVIHEAKFIHDIEFFNAETGLMLAGDGIYKTFDGGEFWLKIYDQKKSIGIDFLDENHGSLSIESKDPDGSWATEEFITNDGGFTWKQLTMEHHKLGSLIRLTIDTLVAYGYDKDRRKGGWFISNNRSDNWQELIVPDSIYLRNIIDTKRFFGGITSNGYKKPIPFTTDGGLTWKNFNLPDSLKDSQGEYWYGIYKTTDDQLYLTTNYSLFKINGFFEGIEFASLWPNSSRGRFVKSIGDALVIICGDQVYQSSDYGKNWKIIGPWADPGENISNGWGGPGIIFMAGTTFLLGVNNASFLNKAEICCDDWKILNRYSHFQDVTIAPGNLIYISTRVNGIHARFEHTYLFESGLKSNMTGISNKYLKFLYLVNPYSGLAMMDWELNKFTWVGDSLIFEMISTPFNEGHSIRSTAVVNGSIYVLTENYSSDFDNTIYTSDDLGITWKKLMSWNNSGGEYINYIYPISDQKLLLSGSSGYLSLFESNSIKNLETNTTSPLYEADFVDGNTGWVRGGFIEYFWDEENQQDVRIYHNTILRTDDGGNTWHTLPESPYYFNDINFLDEQTGWAVGYDTLTQKGVIVKTNNGGESWKLEVGDLYAPLNKIEFRDSIGIAVGYGGLILGYNLNSKRNNSHTNPNNSIRIKSYPNPVSAYSVFEVNSTLRGELSFRIYDLAGKQVSEYNHGYFSHDKLSILWVNPGLNPGLYLVVVEIDGVVQSTKIVIEN